MYPNQDPDQNQYPIDYLNQISTSQQRKGPSKKLVIIVAILGIISLLAVIAMIASSLSRSGGSSSEQLAARLDETEKVVRSAQHKLKSNDLRSLNSNLSIYLSNTLRDLKEPLEAAEININQLNRETVAAEKALASRLTDELEDARLNAIFDQKYAREMTFRLETIQLIMQQIKRETNSKSMSEFIDHAIENLEPIHQELATFSAANE